MKTLSARTLKAAESFFEMDEGGTLSTLVELRRCFAPGTETPEATRRAIQARARASLWFTAYHLLGYSDIETKLHHEMADVWQKYRERPFSLWLSPRGCLKTSIWTIASIVHELLVDPDLTFLLLSSTTDRAEDMLYDIRNHFERNGVLRWIFPEYCIESTRLSVKGTRKRLGQLDMPCRRRVSMTPSITAFGIDGAKVSQHVHRIHCDDMVTDLNSETPKMRDGTYKSYLNLLQLRRDPVHSSVRIVGTIWHYDDTHSRLYRQAESEGGWFTYRRKIMEDGESIWPERFSVEVIKDLKAKLGSYIFACNYECEPVPEGDVALRFSKIHVIDAAQLPQSITYYGACDFKAGEKDAGDYNVVMICGSDFRRNLYVTEIIRDRMDPLRLVTVIERLCKLYDVNSFAIETSVSQNFMLSVVKRVGRQNVFIPFREMRRQRAGSKVKRILALQPLIERGQLFIVKGCQNVHALHEEMDQFSFAGSRGHDDVLDCLADIHTIARPSTEWKGGRVAPPGSIDDIFGPIGDSRYAQPLDRFSAALTTVPSDPWASS